MRLRAGAAVRAASRRQVLHNRARPPRARSRRSRRRARRGAPTAARRRSAASHLRRRSRSNSGTRCSVMPPAGAGALARRSPHGAAQRGGDQRAGLARIAETAAMVGEDRRVRAEQPEQRADQQGGAMRAAPAIVGCAEGRNRDAPAPAPARSNAGDHRRDHHRVDALLAGEADLPVASASKWPHRLGT